MARPLRVSRSSAYAALAASAALGLSAALASAQDVSLTLQDAPLTKSNIRFTIAPLPNSSSWRVEVENRYLKVKHFGIEKGNDSNPMVPRFQSTFTPTCN